MMKSCLFWLNLFADLFRLVALGLRSKSLLAAENLFLRKQLAFYQERKIRPRRRDNPTRLSLVWLSRWFDWRNALTVVTPKTFIGWHRKGFQLFWNGNANPAGHGFHWTSNGWSAGWHTRTQRGVRSESQTSCCSSSACACRRARFGRICQS
jgi:hypothetical protein